LSGEAEANDDHDAGNNWSEARYGITLLLQLREEKRERKEQPLIHQKKECTRCLITINVFDLPPADSHLIHVHLFSREKSCIMRRDMGKGRSS
jgi:hypothetical protein